MNRNDSKAMKCKYEIKSNLFFNNKYFYQFFSFSKIYRELNEPIISSEEKAAAKNCANNFKNMIQIEIKNQQKLQQQKNSYNNTRNMSETPIPLDNKESMTIYENYLSDLVDKDLTLSKHNESYIQPNNSGSLVFKEPSCSNSIDGGYRNMINDYKRKNLIRLEQKEYLDQITTITTTVKTFTKDDLFMLFETNLNENLDIYDNELYSPSLDQLNEITEFTGLNDHSNQNQNEINSHFSCKSPYQHLNTVHNNCSRHSQHHSLIPNINKNIYSCLTNYITDYSII